MSSFEIREGSGGPEAGNEPRMEQSTSELKEYFQSYVSDAEKETEENREAYIDLEKIRGILIDIENSDFSSASEYLDSEIMRMEGIHQKLREEGGMALGDIEEGMPYVERITRLRNSLRT